MPRNWNTAANTRLNSFMPRTLSRQTAMWAGEMVRSVTPFFPAHCTANQIALRCVLPPKWGQFWSREIRKNTGASSALTPSKVNSFVVDHHLARDVKIPRKSQELSTTLGRWEIPRRLQRTLFIGPFIVSLTCNGTDGKKSMAGISPPLWNRYYEGFQRNPR